MSRVALWGVPLRDIVGLRGPQFRTSPGCCSRNPWPPLEVTWGGRRREWVPDAPWVRALDVGHGRPCASPPEPRFDARDLASSPVHGRWAQASPCMPSEVLPLGSTQKGCHDILQFVLRDQSLERVEVPATLRNLGPALQPFEGPSRNRTGNPSPVDFAVIELRRSCQNPQPVEADAGRLADSEAQQR